MAFAAAAAMLLSTAATGNGTPQGGHEYQLNIIGTGEKDPDMSGNQGHRIFVPLEGTARIYLSEGDYGVQDANGTDGRAEFSLPDPGFDEQGNSAYSVYVRSLGQPGGNATMTTCAEMVDDPDLDLRGRDAKQLEGQPDATCSLEQVGLQVEHGRKQFENVTQELLTMQLEIYVEDEPSGICVRIPIFSETLEGEFWEYDNNGVRLTQVRFYDESTNVQLGEHSC